MENIVTLETVEIETFLNTLGLAFGGRSQITWQVIGMALRGHVENGGWRSINVEDTMDKIINSESDFWQWENLNAVTVEGLRNEILRGYNR